LFLQSEMLEQRSVRHLPCLPPRTRSAFWVTLNCRIRPNIHDMRPKTLGRLVAAAWVQTLIGKLVEPLWPCGHVRMSNSYR